MLLRVVPRKVCLNDVANPAHFLRTGLFVAGASSDRILVLPAQRRPYASSPAAIHKLIKNIPSLQPNHIPVRDSEAAEFNKALVAIRRVVSEANAPVAIELWIWLKHRSLVHLLGPSDLKGLAQLLTDTCRSTGGKEMKAAEEMAVAAALARFADPLVSCMIFHIKNNNPDAVIKLSEFVMKYLESQNGVDGDVASGSDLGIENPLSTSLSTPLDPGRTSLLLAVVTAYVMKNSFEAALETCLRTKARFHHFTTQAFLSKLDYDAALKGKVEAYINRLNIACMVARPPSFSKYVTNMAEAHSVEPLIKLYDDLTEGLSGPEAYLAADPSLITSTKRVALTNVGWTSLLVAFLKSGQRSHAAKLWDEMTKYGLRPSLSMWTALLDTYASTGAVDDAVAGWKMMIEQKIKPDCLAYRAILSALFNARLVDEAMIYFRQFQKSPVPQASPQHLLAVYNTTIHGLLYDNRLADATTLLRDMELNGPTPDLVTFNTLLRYHGRRNDFKSLAAVVKKMTTLNVTGDVYTFSTILSALLKVGKKDATKTVLKIMQSQGVKPNTTYNTAIIDNLMREQTEESFREALHMLQEMERDPSTKPNEVTFTAILGGLHRGHWLPPERVEYHRKEIIQRMKRLNVTFNLQSYHIILKGCLEYPPPEGLQAALFYYREMRRQKLKFEDTTWYIILAGLLHRGEWEVAKEVVEDMSKNGARTDRRVLGLVGQIKAHKDVNA